MKDELIRMDRTGLLSRVATYGSAYRQKDRPLHPTADLIDLRAAFCTPLPETGNGSAAVIDDLISAAEPGLVSNTGSDFYAWVMGGSDMVGVSADVLTSIWGQNAAIFQTSPAAAVAEEAVSTWLLDLLDLPRSASVGFVTGATMATFVGLAAARSEVLRRVGYDLEAKGLSGAPAIHVFLSDDGHIANHAALRYLGIGTDCVCRVPSDDKGLMSAARLRDALEQHQGPKIVIGQAGHINSGGFEDFEALSQLAKMHDAWLHVDGAFGLWARVLPEKVALTRGLDLADSWSVDGHKWLQLPYDSGFAIVRDPVAHRRAMDFSAGYLNVSDADGRNPTSYNPELSRRARGFAAWAVLRHLGRQGVQALVRTHCQQAQAVAQRLRGLEGLEDIAPPDLNQLVLRTSDPTGKSDRLIIELETRLNAAGAAFVRSAKWMGRDVLRLSFVAAGLTTDDCLKLAELIRSEWSEIRRLHIAGHDALRDGS